MYVYSGSELVYQATVFNIGIMFFVQLMQFEAMLSGGHDSFIMVTKLWMNTKKYVFKKTYHSKIFT